jgi:hypothetical protein
MNCREVKTLLVPYLDNEIIPSERTLIQSHLAGCESCQRELEALSSTRIRLAQSLKTRAAQAAPSPQALSHLQARLADDAQRPPRWLTVWLRQLAPGAGRTHSTSQGKLPMNKKTVLTIVASVFILATTAAFVPPVRAAIIKAFSFTVASAPIDVDLTSLPGYLPQFESGPIAGGGSASAIAVSGDNPAPAVPESNTNIYQKDDKFLVFTTQEAGGGQPLPDGEAIDVNGQPGVLQSALSGVFTFGGGSGQDADGNPVEMAPIIINYSNANKITWLVGNTMYEMLSNLSVEEMLNIAATLVPAK